MGIVVVPTFGADPVTITGPTLDAKVDGIATEFNGNIDNDNIKSAAAIAASKLNLATIAQVMAMSSKNFLFAKGADVASATTITLGTDGNFFDITGTTTIDGITAKQAGSVVWLQFDGIVSVRSKITSSTGNIFNGGTGTTGGFDISTEAGDVLGYVCDGTNWILFDRQPERPIVFALTDAATIATNASQGDIFTVTLTDNRTLGAPTVVKHGMKRIWRFKQDATGSRTITLNAVFRTPTDIGTVTLSTTANMVDYLGAIYNSTDTKWDICGFIKGFAA